MELIFEVFKEFENKGMQIECGWKEKDRKKEMTEAMKKIKESGDDNKIRYLEKLVRFYFILNNIGFLLKKTEMRFDKEDKYGMEDLYHFLEDNVVDTGKRSICGVMTSISNDEPLEDFYKRIMNPFLFKDNEKEEEGKVIDIKSRE